MFDWEIFWVSSIKFDCRTQSYSIARLRSITERSIGFSRNEERVGIKSKIYVFSFNYKA